MSALLRHVVLFAFKPDTSESDIQQIESAFVNLKNEIDFIVDLEWGINNSPEGKDKGFTHCFFLSFKDEDDRDRYLPHPAHKAFGSLLHNKLQDVLVVDYWTN